MAKATYLLRKASELVREKRYQDAVEVYLRATETAPSDSRAWFGLGVCLFRVGNLDVSRIALQRARHMGYPRAEEALARVEAAEKRRQEEGSGAKATVAPAEAERRAARRPEQVAGPPPRPTVRPDDEKIELVRPLRIMLVEERDEERRLITRSIEGCLKGAEVVSVPYGVSTSETMSGTVHYDAAVLDWDRSPDATSGLIQILKIKRPTLFVICLTEDWDPETAVEILEAGADYHLVRNAHFASTLPLILAQWSDRDYAVVDVQAQQTEKRSDRWTDVLNSLEDIFLLVDPTGNVVFANPAAMRAFSRGEEQIVAQPYADLLYGHSEPPDDCPVARALAMETAGGGCLSQPEAGREFSMQAWPVLARSGKMTGVSVLLTEGAAEQAVLPEPAAPEPYAHLADRLGVGVLVVRPDATVGYVNPGLCDMLGRTESELLDEPVEALALPGEDEALRQCLAAAGVEGQAAERITVQGPEGLPLSAQAQVARFVEAGETCLVVSLAAVAAPEPVEVEADYGREGHAVEDAADALLCGMVVLDNESRVTWLNELAADMLGLEADMAVGQDYIDLVREALQGRLADAGVFLEALTAAHEEGEALEEYPFILDMDDGAARYYSTPLDEGVPSASRVEHFYLTAAPEAAMPPVDTAGARLTEILSTLPEMLFRTDAEGRFTWCSPAAGALTGQTPDRLLGMRLPDLVGDQMHVEDLLREVLDAGLHVGSEELVLSRADGTQRWVELTLIPGEREDEGPTVEGVLRDVTDRKRTEAIRALLSGDRLPSPPPQAEVSNDGWPRV